MNTNPHIPSVASLTLPASLSFAYMGDVQPARDEARKAGLHTEVIENDLKDTDKLRYTLNIREFAVGDGATLSGYSDCHACTVIARTAKTLTLRRDKATLLNGTNSGQPDALRFSPGGFVGHTSGTQRYEYSSDPSGYVVIARLTKTGWKAQGKALSAGRHEHYDFNF